MAGEDPPAPDVPPCPDGPEKKLLHVWPSVWPNPFPLPPDLIEFIAAPNFADNDGDNAPAIRLASCSMMVGVRNWNI